MKIGVITFLFLLFHSYCYLCFKEFTIYSFLYLFTDIILQVNTGGIMEKQYDRNVNSRKTDNTEMHRKHRMSLLHHLQKWLSVN